MKIKLILLVLIVLGILGYLVSVTLLKESPSQIISPQARNFTQVKATPTITPTPTPVEFNFDSSTDLKQELELVNPEVKKTDFEPLEKIIEQLK